MHVGTASAFNSSAGQTKDFDPTGWELALVSTPRTDISSANERQLVAMQQQANPFGPFQPFHPQQQQQQNVLMNPGFGSTGLL